MYEGQTKTLQKVFRAMEMIVASRVGKVRGAAESITVYDSVITTVMAAVSTHSSLNYPLITEHTDTRKVAVLAVTSDRGMARTYSAAILWEAECLIEWLHNEGKEPVIHVSGRRTLSYFNSRGTEIATSQAGNLDRPPETRAQETTRHLLGDLLVPADQGEVSELYMVYTKFRSMVSQIPQIRKMLPIRVINPDEEIQTDGMSLTDMRKGSVLSPYEFEPNAYEVLETVMSLYVESRIRATLLHVAAAELASRQNATYSTTDSARDLISGLTRKMSQARQAEITTEISEIVSGVDALKETKK